MDSDSIVAIVTTHRMQATRDFYLRQLGFELSYDHSHYLGVRAGRKGTPELGFMLPDREAPQEFGGAGITLAIRVGDADRECERLRRAGVPILQEPTDQPWGARNFVVQDPNGVVIAISHPTSPTVEFATCAR